MKISNYWQTLHQQKILKTFTCLLSLNYLVWRPASWKNLAWVYGFRALFLQVDQQKVTGFFPYFFILFMRRFVY